MPQTVDIQGFGQVEFPDSMSPSDIQSAIENEILPRARQQQAQSPALPNTRSVGDEENRPALPDPKTVANRMFDKLSDPTIQVPVHPYGGAPTVPVNPDQLERDQPVIGGIINAPGRGVQNIAGGVEQMAEPDAAEKLRGAGKVFVGAGQLLSPAFGYAAASAPLDAAAWYALSKGLTGLGKEGGKAAGLSPEDADELGNVLGTAPLLEGTAKAFAERFENAIDAHNTRAARLVAQDAARGQGVDMGANIVGEEGTPVGPDGWKVTVNGASKNGRPNYAVVDQGGKTLYAGNAREVQNWLQSQGVEKSPVPDQVAEAIVEQAKQSYAQDAAARKAAALDHIRANPDANIADVRQQFRLGERTAQRLFDFVAGERNATQAIQPDSSPGGTPTVTGPAENTPAPTDNPAPAIVKSPSDYAQPHALAPTPTTPKSGAVEPTKVEVPGVGTVAFPPSMSHEEITQAIETDILPQADVAQVRNTTEETPESEKPSAPSAPGIDKEYIKVDDTTPESGAVAKPEGGGTKYVLPSFVTAQYADGKAKPEKPTPKALTSADLHETYYGPDIIPPKDGELSQRQKNNLIKRTDAFLLAEAKRKVTDPYQRRILEAINLDNMAPADRTTIKDLLGLDDDAVVDWSKGEPRIVTGQPEPEKSPNTPESGAVDAEENPTETLSYRNKGRHKIDIHLKEQEGGQWHYSADYNLQGLAGGVHGSHEPLASRDEAITAAVHSFRRHLAQIAEGRGGGNAAQIAEAGRMVAWLDSNDPANIKAADESSTTPKSGAVIAKEIEPYFRNTEASLAGRPTDALRWVRGGEGRFAPGAIEHAEIDGGIGLLHGEAGDAANKFRGGFGVAHIDAKRSGHLDEALKVIPSLPVIETITDQKTGRVLGKVLSNGVHRAVVSMDLRGHETPNWLLTSYERPASATSSSVREAVDESGSRPTPLETGAHDSSVSANGSAEQSGAPEAGTVAALPHPRMPQLVNALAERLLNNGSIKDTPALVKIAGDVLGDGLTSGKYEIKDLYDALETAVNRLISATAWGEALAYLPFADVLKNLEGLLQRLPTQTARTKGQKEFQQFSTPPTLSYLAAKALSIRRGETILEPSAGTGSLAAFAKLEGAHVETNELSPSRTAFLELQGYRPTSVNAERIHDHRPDLRPTGVLMNPPFSADAGRTGQNRNSVGYQHVLSALDTLPVGGRLVAILGRGASPDHVTAAPFFTEIKHRGASVRANIGLDGSNYSKYGTTFDNRLIIIDKVPGLKDPVTGEFKDLLAAYDALRTILVNRPEPERVESSASIREREDGGSAQSSEELPSTPDRNGKRGDRRGRSGQSPAVVAPAGPGGDVDPHERPELADGSERPIEPVPGDHAGSPELPERHEPVRESRRVKPANQPVEKQGAYQQYVPAKLYQLPEHYPTGVSHKDATGTGLVETGAMASVELPDIHYVPSLPARILASGKITDAQLEAIVYAGQAHARTLPDGKRAGFMIGDGTGVGKGTEAAGIALDNWNQGRRKILWVSLKPGLIKQAQRDLDWVEAPIQAKMLNDYDFNEPIDHEGVVFGTYSMLFRAAKEQGGKTRLQQLLDWAPDVILFDESHSAKNAVTEGGDESERDEEGGASYEQGRLTLKGEASKAGIATLDLQNGLPDARVTYFSATAFTDTANLGYANRLGLWGAGTSFPEGFKDFQVQIDRGGVGAMELVAKEMKAVGSYIARQISFDGVTFREAEAKLSQAQREMYDAAVNAWQEIFRNIDKAIAATTGKDDRRSKALQKMAALSAFWGTNQRFYRGLITAMKIPTVIEEIEKALNDPHDPRSVFIDLVGTGEAQAKREMERAAEENLSFDDLDMSAKAMILGYVDKCFPVNIMEDYVDPETKVRKTRPVLDAQGNPVQSQAALAMREKLREELDKIQLPQGPLDQIIDYFGPDAVAEISGRGARIVQDPKTGRAMQVKRVKPKGAKAKDINDWERQQFQSGKKRIAIASGAGGTGFDFHSDKRNANQQRRVHIVLEPSWSADQQMQKFGRTHRTNQANAPEYILIASDLGGEKRFISAIASRIASLGALTRGERRAGGGAAEMLAKYNLEGIYGEAAKNAFFNGLAGRRAILQDDVTINLAKLPAEIEELGPMALCRLLGVVHDTEEGPRVTVPALKTFMNRLLNLPTSVQGAAFNYFMNAFENIIEAVKAAGVFDEGTQELKTLGARVTDKETIRTAEGGGQTNHVTVEAEFPLDRNSWETAVHHVNQGERSDYNQQQYAGLYRNVRSGKLWMARKAAKDQTDQTSGALIPTMALLGPAAGSRQMVPVAALADKSKYERIPNGDAQQTWEKALAEIPNTEKQEVHIINGSLLPVWRQIGASGDDYRMDVVSVDTENQGTVTGIRIPAEQVSALKDSLTGSGLASPGMILNRVWKLGERVLLRDAVLSAGRVQGERAIVIQPAKPSVRPVLDSLGIKHIETASSVRYYLPYADQPSAELHQSTLAKLTEVLQAFPPKVETAEEALERRRAFQSGSVPINVLTAGLAKKLSEAFHGKDGEPERNYSGLGAMKSKLVRNLSQVEEASPTVHRAAVKAASSRAQASVLMRAAWRRVGDALGTQMSGEDFRRVLIESRLEGIEERWRDLATAAQTVAAKDLVDWVLQGPLQLLDAMSPDTVDGEATLAQTAANLAENLSVLPKAKWNRNATARLRHLVAGAFDEAADSVHHMMDRAEFDQLTQNPAFGRGLVVYKRDIETHLAQSHAENEGVFSTALGPLNTYYPLTPIRAEDQAAAVLGARRGFKKPANISNKFATGLAEDYDTGLEAFREKAEAAIRVNDKAALIEALQSAGMLQKLRPDQTADTVRFRGREFVAKVVSVGPARVIVQPDGKIVRVAEQRAAVPEPFYHELLPILEPAHRIPRGWLHKIIDLANTFTLSGPAEAVIHAHNLVGAMIGNTPFLGSDWATKTIGNTPLTKTFTALLQIIRTDPMDARATSDLREMAKLGILPERFGTETYSKKYAEATGAHLKHFPLSWAPVLYGPKGIDVRARLLMYRLAKEIQPNASSIEIYKFVNQLGNYTEALQGHFERAAKRTGFSRFYTAGSTMLRNGIDTWLGTGSGSGPGGGKGNRAAQMLSGGAIGMVAAWIVAYHAMTGKWPWQDRRAKLLKIPAPDGLRKSKIGLALWGHDLRRVGYINFGTFSPHVGRGARGLGIDGMVNTRIEGGNWKQMGEAAKRDMVNSGIHPIAGPVARAGMVIATGKQPYLVQDADHGGSQFLSAMPKRAPMGSEILSGIKQLNSFYGNVGAAVGIVPGDDRRATWDEEILKGIVDMTGLSGGASNPYAIHQALQRERLAHK